MLAARAFAVIAAFLAASMPRAGAQQLPFRVTIVSWDLDAGQQQRRDYRSESNEHEVLFCVDEWKKTPVQLDADRITITHVFRERTGRRHEIRDVGSQCLDTSGKPLPTLHTHSDGNCQFSKADLTAIVSRGAPFDGIQCGDRYFVWTFAWHILAIAASVEREQLRRTGALP